MIAPCRPVLLVSVDLDDARCYHAIHGLAQPQHTGMVAEVCVPRLLRLFADLGVHATFFAIGRAIEAQPKCWGPAVQAIVSAGHELANHSYAHAYDMHRWPRDVIVRDLQRCHEQLTRFGANPVGFRAPGYIHSAQVLSAVESLGYRYDSSRLPSLLYFAAKVAMIMRKRVGGQRSASSVRGVMSFFGPRTPEQVGRLWELPVSTIGWPSVPVLGSALWSLPPVLARAVVARARRLPYLHVQLHALDLVDRADEGWEAALHQRQPEFWWRLPNKLRLLAELLTPGNRAVRTLASLASDLDVTAR